MTQGSPAIILTLYRPGSLPLNAVFFREFTTLLERLALMSGIIVITGDLNIRLDRPTDVHCVQFHELLESFGFEQRVTLPTHRMGGLLDVVISREGSVGGTPEVRDVGLSDHSCVLWELNVTRSAPVYRSIECRDWKSFSLDSFQDDLGRSALCHYDAASPPSVTVSGCATTAMVEQYNDVLSALLERHAVPRTLLLRDRPSDGWFDEECRALKRHCRMLERRLPGSGNPLDRAEWVDKVRAMHKIFNMKKAAFISSMIETEGGDPKRLWRILNATMGLSEPELEIPHTAEEFTRFFADKVANIRALTANAPPPLFAAAPPSFLMSFKSVSEESVTELIMKAPSKHSKADPLPTWLLKQCVALLAPFLTQLINTSIATCTMPDCLKAAVVTPIIKKSNLDSADISNFRPVSNLSFISKLLERTVSHQLTSYLEGGSLLPLYQSAYRANHSTETAILRVHSDLVAASDAGDISLLALLDLSAAFDTVDYDILFNRLTSDFGVSGSALAWLKSYLLGRRQSVCCHGVLAPATELTCGVPQGSCLGPLLFLLYTAGLHEVIQRHGLRNHCYADDSEIYGSCHPRDSKTLREKMLHCISDVSTWMASNRLKLNPAKTELMWCSTPGMAHHVDHVTPFIIGHVPVKPVTTVRLLGVMLDSELTMTTHVSRTVSTCFYQLRRLKSARRSLPTESAKSLVSAFVTSRLDYCNGVLAGVAQRQIDRLQAVLNAAARLLYGGTKRDHITPLIKDKLHWLRFAQRITYKLCVLVYKSLHGCAPGYLSELVVPAGNASAMRLRSADNHCIVRPRSRLKFGDRGFSIAAPDAWNSLPLHVKTASSLSIFTEKLKTELFLRSYA